MLVRVIPDIRIMEIRDFIDRMDAHSPCERGAKMIREATTRSDVFKCIADNANSDFLIASIRDGWGPSPDDLLRLFPRRVNGAVTDGFQMWVRHSGRIPYNPEVKRMAIIDSKCCISIPSGTVIKVLMCGDSFLNVDGDEYTYVLCNRYGGRIVGSGGVDIKKIEK